MKYQPSPQLITLAARQSALSWQALFSDDTFDVLCPMPSNPSRLKLRGFDHMYHFTQKLKKQVASLQGATVSSLLEIDRNSKAQTDLRNARQRIKNMKKALRISGSCSPKGKSILLLDDVFTTGASIVFASTVLLEAGAKNVSAFTLARSPSAPQNRHLLAALLPFPGKQRTLNP